MHERTKTDFYVFGSSPQETRDPEWVGTADGFTVINPETGIYVADGLDICLVNGHRYVALKLRNTPYWLVGERNLEQSGLALQQFLLLKDQLHFLDKATSQDWKEVAAMWSYPTVPWRCQARFLEFASSLPALMLHKRKGGAASTTAAAA